MRRPDYTVITNAQLLSPGGKAVWSHIIIHAGKIESIIPASEDYTSHIRESFTTMQVYDAKGHYVLPGLVDMHVHFREPGYSYKETIYDGSRAALAGGFTTVCTMPNLNPAPDNISNLRKQLDIISRDALMQVIPYATITEKRMGDTPVDFHSLAPWTAGFSDDGSGVQSEEVMHHAMEGVAGTGKILAAHCEVNSLLNGGYIHDGEYCRRHGHRGICSESEWREVERDIRLAEKTGCRLHVCHISTKESVSLIREAKARGVKVTCETGPHYLTFRDEDILEEGRFKMNPPIRSAEDREALRQGLIDGTIDVIATDHAPHSDSEKNKGLEKSAMGVIGLETAYRAVYTDMVASGFMPFSRLAEAMTFTPRHILGLPSAEGLAPGDPADIVILSTEGEAQVSGPFYSCGSATPYEGATLKGHVVATFYSGLRAYPFE